MSREPGETTSGQDAPLITQMRTEIGEQPQALRAVGAAGAEVEIEQQQRRTHCGDRGREFGRAAHAGDGRDSALQQQLCGQADVGVVVEKKDRAFRHGCECRSLADARCRGVSGCGQPPGPANAAPPQCTS